MPHGLVHAFIWAPPGQFVIDTPSSRAVDLGCAYTLEVQPDGRGLIEVTAGWVAFEHAGRESFIPAGARCATRAGVGPGTPYMIDAPPALAEALALLDFGPASGPARAAALSRVLAAARPDDAVTLWHLLARVPAADRGAVFDVLAGLVPPPRGRHARGHRARRPGDARRVVGRARLGRRRVVAHMEAALAVRCHWPTADCRLQAAGLFWPQARALVSSGHQH